MPPGQTVKRTVDEQVLVSHGSFAFRERQQVEQHLGIAGGCVGFGRHRSVVEFVAKERTLPIQNGLSGHD